MDSHIGGGARNPSSGYLNYSQNPFADSSERINDSALMALPYIAIYVGIDEFIPSLAVYGVYDPRTASIRFVHGDGTFIIPERISFTESFNSDFWRPRTHLVELYQRSAKHYQIIHSGPSRELSQIKCRFATLSTVKKALTHLSNLKWSPDPPPALQKIPDDYSTRSFEHLQDQSMCMPCISITSDPKWVFDPKGFQARISREKEEEFKNKYEEFKKKYRSHVSSLDFQHAAFCLAGLEAAGFVSFAHEPQNDPRTRLDSGLFPGPVRKFEEIKVAYKLVVYPNPIRWLEAELETEMKLHENRDGYHLLRPWKGKVAHREVPPVLTWEVLKGLEWHLPDASTVYPRHFTPLSQQPLSISDIISPKTGKFKESKKARMQRKQQEKDRKIFREAHGKNTIDLTQDAPGSSGHMNNPPTMNGERTFHTKADTDVYEADLSEGVTSIRRKRNHGQVGSGARTFEMSGPQRQSDLYVLQPVKDGFLDNEDLHGGSDLETAIKEELRGRKRSSRRPDSETPMKQFKRPHLWDELKDDQLLEKSNPNLSLKYIEEIGFGSHSPLMSNGLLHINQSASVPCHTKKQEAETGFLNPKSSSLHLVPLNPATGKKCELGSNKHINVKSSTTDSDSDSIDEIELIENPALLPPSFRRKLKSYPRREHYSLLPQSDSRNKGFLSRPKTLSEACDVFENLHTTSAPARGRDLSQDSGSDNEILVFQPAIPRWFSRDISPMPTFRDFVKRRTHDGRVTSSTTTNSKSKLDARDKIKYGQKMLPSTSDDMILSSDQPLPSIETVGDVLE